ncbi:DNA ligase [Bacterioplanoides sp. SCSIO 12839]|uniref:DNA ligase n=1 Tax=Bacterioplanoides sp. SCSIO 12839 TaxID=2829569 RepID=UPI002101EFFA|nr:DNA ligase [Bacterioplanoides sp. SCSIO 12839]UTW47345.1 DNA ligase [Bacterioplanoides sp. SCSIO 12839]
MHSYLVVTALVTVSLLFSLFPLWAASGQLAPPPLMLATHYISGIDVRKYYVSEKLDGVRAYWDGRQLYTRSGRVIPAPLWFVAGLPTTRLDGELWLGRGRFEEMSSLVRTIQPVDQSWREVKFMVYDLPEMVAPFHERYWLLKTLVAEQGTPWLKALTQKKVVNEAALNDWLQQVVAAGGEGLMLRHGRALYQVKRSQDLLKLKPRDDAEATVIDYVAGEGKYRGMVGALVVRDQQGREFRLGSGLTDAQRQTPPAIGSEVTYSYNGLTNTGLPRFARFVRVRPDE